MLLKNRECSSILISHSYHTCILVLDSCATDHQRPSYGSYAAATAGAVSTRSPETPQDYPNTEDDDQPPNVHSASH
eukprot:Em0020g833a